MIKNEYTFYCIGNKVLLLKKFIPSVKDKNISIVISELELENKSIDIMK